MVEVKNSQLFPNVFHPVESVEQGSSLGKHAWQLRSRRQGPGEGSTNCHPRCVGVVRKSFNCLAIQPLITCAVDSFVYLLSTSTCDFLNDRHHLQGLCNTGSSNCILNSLKHLNMMSASVLRAIDFCHVSMLYRALVLDRQQPKPQNLPYWGQWCNTCED